jgi:predicted Fe-Mo cluster-binding NifX family protein
MRRIAIAANKGKVATHFGRCPEYIFVDIENNKIQNKKKVENPGHKPGYIPRFLIENNVNCIISGGMGRKAKQIFDDNNIEVVVGASGDIDVVIKNYIQDKLENGENVCDHEEGHSH